MCRLVNIQCSYFVINMCKRRFILYKDYGCHDYVGWTLLTALSESINLRGGYQCQSSGAEIDFCHRQGDSVDIHHATDIKCEVQLAPKLTKCGHL